MPCINYPQISSQNYKKNTYTDSDMGQFFYIKKPYHCLSKYSQIDFANKTYFLKV